MEFFGGEGDETVMEVWRAGEGCYFGMRDLGVSEAKDIKGVVSVWDGGGNSGKGGFGRNEESTRGPFDVVRIVP